MLESQPFDDLPVNVSLVNASPSPKPAACNSNDNAKSHHIQRSPRTNKTNQPPHITTHINQPIQSSLQQATSQHGKCKSHFHIQSHAHDIAHRATSSNHHHRATHTASQPAGRARASSARRGLQAQRTMRYELGRLSWKLDQYTWRSNPSPTPPNAGPQTEL